MIRINDKFDTNKRTNEFDTNKRTNEFDTNKRETNKQKTDNINACDTKYFA